MMKKQYEPLSGKNSWSTAHRDRDWHVQHRLQLNLQRRNDARRKRRSEVAAGTPKE